MKPKFPAPWEDPKNGSTQKGSVIYTIGMLESSFLDPPRALGSCGAEVRMKGLLGL